MSLAAFADAAFAAQGYTVAPHEIELSLDDFKSEFAANGSVDRKALNFWCESPGSGAKIFVFYADERNVGVKTMRTFVQTLETHTSAQESSSGRTR